MKELQSRFFHTCLALKKLHISSILPGINVGDLTTLKTLKHLEQKRIQDEADADGKGVAVSEIVSELQVPAPAVSRSLRSLEEKDYVLRYVNKKDRRNTCVELTGQGEAILEESMEIMSDLGEAVFRQMGEEDMERLLSYFEKLQNVAKEEIEKRKYHKKGKDPVNREEDI